MDERSSMDFAGVTLEASDAASSLLMEKFTCCVCHEAAAKPATMPCQHMLCLPCAGRMWQHKEAQTPLPGDGSIPVIDCPVCRRPCANVLQPNVELAVEFSTISVVCSHRCGETRIPMGLCADGIAYHIYYECAAVGLRCLLCRQPPLPEECMQRHFELCWEERMKRFHEHALLVMSKLSFHLNCDLQDVRTVRAVGWERYESISLRQLNYERYKYEEPFYIDIVRRPMAPMSESFVLVIKEPLQADSTFSETLATMVIPLAPGYYDEVVRTEQYEKQAMKEILPLCRDFVGDFKLRYHPNWETTDNRQRRVNMDYVLQLANVCDPNDPQWPLRVRNLLHVSPRDAVDMGLESLLSGLLLDVNERSAVGSPSNR